MGHRSVTGRGTCTHANKTRDRTERASQNNIWQLSYSLAGIGRGARINQRDATTSPSISKETRCLPMCVGLTPHGATSWIPLVESGVLSGKLARFISSGFSSSTSLSLPSGRSNLMANECVDSSSLANWHETTSVIETACLSGGISGTRATKNRSTMRIALITSSFSCRALSQIMRLAESGFGIPAVYHSLCV